MTTYVYGIARDERADPAGRTEPPELPGLPEGLTGVGDPPRPVRVVGGGGLSAVVSDCPERLRPKRRDLLAHQRVLAEVGRRSTVLPMRFGSVSDSDEKVRAVLAEHAERYREQLERLTGRVEYNVKAAHREEAVLHVVLARNAELRALAAANRVSGGGSYEERLRFGELVAGGVRECEVRDAALVADALRPLAEECRPGPESAGWFVNLSFLLTRAAAQRLVTTAAGLEQAHPQLDLKVHGPLPPYSFVTP